MQETIAVLGSIDATWLPEFWAGIDKKAAAKLKVKDWELNSLRARTAFWGKANHRLKQLTNRLGPETKRIRIAAHKRVPWPMEAGLKRLELLEAKKDLDGARGLLKVAHSHVKGDKKAIKRAQEELAKSEEFVRKSTAWGAEAAAKLAKLSGDSR